MWTSTIGGRDVLCAALRLSKRTGVAIQQRKNTPVALDRLLIMINLLS
jgi:hypothetical protein